VILKLRYFKNISRLFLFLFDSTIIGYLSMLPTPNVEESYRLMQAAMTARLETSVQARERLPCCSAMQVLPSFLHNLATCLCSLLAGANNRSRFVKAPDTSKPQASMSIQHLMLPSLVVPQNFSSMLCWSTVWLLGLTALKHPTARERSRQS
jgi:hypothetical protein